MDSTLAHEHIQSADLVRTYKNTRINKISSSLEHANFKQELDQRGAEHGSIEMSEGGLGDADGQITYSLYLTYLGEIEELQGQQCDLGQERERLASELLHATAKLDTLERSLHHRQLTSVDVHKQIFQDEDAMDYMENTYQEELRALRAENEDVALLKHRVSGRIADTKAEADGLRTLTRNIEAKLLEVQDELDKLKAAKIAYEEYTGHEKEQMKLQVQKLSEQNKDLSKSVDSITTEIAAKSKTQKHLETTLQKTKEELRSLAKQFSKKQEKEEASANNRKASLYEGVVAGGAPTGEVTLVFSSVDGSKEQWEMFPVAMTLAIDMHNNILKNRIKSAGGYEVKSDGDSFMVAFSDVLAGLQYCMLVQEDLLGATWPQEILTSQYAAEKLSLDGRVLFCGLRCRMGLHVGKPQCRPNPVTGRMDYLGSMVNKSARVAGLAHGGQVFASDAAVKHLFEIKDENCRVYLSQLGIRIVGTFPLRGIQGQEKITEILPHTLRDRQFLPVGTDVPQSPTAAVAAKDVPGHHTPKASGSEIGEHETPGAQFAKFAEIPEPLPHAPVGGPAQPAPTSVSTLPSSNSSQPSPFQLTYLPSYPASHPSSQPATLQIPAQLSVSIPSPSDTPIPSPLTGNFLESMASMEYLTNSLLTSMAITTSTSTGQVPSMAERPTGRHSLSPSPSLLTPHPDDAIQSKYEEKLKAAEERLIHLKSDLARTKTEKDDFRDKLRSLKEKEKTLKSRYIQEANVTQERQQDLAKMAFEKLHTNQLLERANLNISSIRALLKNLEGRTVLSTANRDHARNAYHHWDKMMQLCSQEGQAYAKKSTQLEAEWAALRNGKMVYFNSAKGLETKINQAAESNAMTSPQHAEKEEGMLIGHVLDYRAVESDTLMMTLFYKEKVQENDALKAYIQQLTAAVSTASDSHNRVVATTRELAERTMQQEQQLQRLLLEKQRQAQDVQDLQRTYVQEVHQQLKTIKLSQSDVGTESQRTKDIKCKFGGAVADKYQEVVEHLQAIETSQKLASSKEKEKRSAMSKSLGVDKRLLSSMDRGDESRLTTLDKGRHQSTLSLLESGSASMRRDIMRGSRSPTERDASVRTAKPFSSTTSLLGERGAKFERGTLDDPAAETEKVEGGALMDGTKLDVAGDNRVARDKASASFGSTSGGGSGEGVERRTGYDFRSIALVQNELANRLADTRQLETCSLDNTRDQMATLSRLMKGTRSEEADLSIIGIGVDGHSLVDDTQQRGMSLSLFRLAMQIRPDAYHHRRTHSNNSKSLSSSSSSSVWGRKSMDELKVSGQKLIL